MSTESSPDRPALSVVESDDSADALSIDELGARIVGLAGRLAAASCRWLLLVAAFHARAGHEGFGLNSTGAWLMHYCGLSRRTAYEHVRVAQALAAHPALSAAMASGHLSYSHVRAISRLADEASEQLLGDLVAMAEHSSIEQLESTVRGLRTVQRNADPAPELAYLTRWWADDSRWRMTTRLDPDDGALVQSTIEALARRDGLTNAQALVRMAELALAASNRVAEAAGGADPAVLRGDERAAVVIHLDAAAVPAEPEVEAQPQPAAQCSAEHSPPRSTPHSPLDCSTRAPVVPPARIAGGPGLPDSVVLRLLCAGRIRTAVRDRYHDVLALGTTRRLVSDRQLRALLLRHGRCCAHPGCTSRQGLEAHHVRHWLHGGPTNLDNLVLLCEHHHHVHHDGGCEITARGHGRFDFRRADGSLLPDHVHLRDDDEVPVDREHEEVAADAATTRWDGTRLDRAFAVSVLSAELKLPEPPRRSWPDDWDPWAMPPPDAA